MTVMSWLVRWTALYIRSDATGAPPGVSSLRTTAPTESLARMSASSLSTSSARAALTGPSISTTATVSSGSLVAAYTLGASTAPTTAAASTTAASCCRDVRAVEGFLVDITRSNLRQAGNKNFGKSTIDGSHASPAAAPTVPRPLDTGAYRSVGRASHPTAAAIQAPSASDSRDTEMTASQTVDASRRFLRAVRAGEERDAEREAARDALAGLAESDLDALTPDERLAFWLNAYNAATGDALLSDPTRLANRRQFFSTPRLTVAGEALSLDAVEHGILRGSQWKYGLGYVPNPFPSA